MKMRGSETVKEDFKTQIFDIFGTVDLEQLRAIAQKVQLIESEKPHNERGAGRKNSLTPQQLAEMLALHQQGMGATELAKKYARVRAGGRARCAGRAGRAAHALRRACSLRRQP